MPGIDVEWSTLEGGGEVGEARTETDSNGRAFTSWHAGRSDLTQRLEARVGSLSAVFTAELDMVGTWESLPPLPLPVRAATASTDGSSIFVFGGTTADEERTTATQAFDIADGSWTQLSPMPEALEWSGAVYRDGRVHLLAGVSNARAASDSHWIYDIGDDSWSAGVDLSIAAAGAAVGILNDEILVVGGIDGPGQYSNHVRSLSVSSGVWSSGTPSPASWINWQGAVIDDLFYVGGGTGPGRVTSDDVLAYDPRLDVWSSVSTLPTPTEGFAGARVGTMYCILGGREAPSSGSYNTPYSLVDCYEPVLDHWFVGDALPTAVQEAAAVHVGGFLYVAGGRVGVTEVTGTFARLGPG